MIKIEEFDKIDMRVGTIIEVKINKRAKRPAYKVVIDLGKEIGIKNSSAQITELYSEQELIGKQVIVVINFEPMRIGDVKSEVRILGADTKKGVILLKPEKIVENGLKIF